MVPSSSIENENIIKEFKKVKLDDENHINEVGFKIINNESLETKHIVFIHGYGSSLGCFARNFQLINKFKNRRDYNYHIHFLDNLTFGLSSNPKIDNPAISWKIPKPPKLKMIDSNDSKLYNKYYKLISGFQIDPEEFKQYQEFFMPILTSLEQFYCQAIENWRIASDINHIDYLIGHSFGGYWSGSYGLKYPDKLKNLILLSPVGMERHALAITNDQITNKIQKPTLDPTSYNFLSRYPVLSKDHILKWYYKIPYLPRILPFLGHFGTQMYFGLWMKKLLKINKLIDKHGGPQWIFKNTNDLVYGKQKEVELIIEYLYNSITSGTNSDIYIKYLLTPATVSKWPLYDKFLAVLENDKDKLRFNCHVMYGEYDFMNSEAGKKLIDKLNKEINHKEINHKEINHKEINDKVFKYYEIPEGGHNLYLDNPFDTNQTIYDVVVTNK